MPEKRFMLVKMSVQQQSEKFDPEKHPYLVIAVGEWDEIDFAYQDRDNPALYAITTDEGKNVRRSTTSETKTTVELTNREKASNLCEAMQVIQENVEVIQEGVSHLEIKVRITQAHTQLSAAMTEIEDAIRREEYLENASELTLSEMPSDTTLKEACPSHLVEALLNDCGVYEVLQYLASEIQERAR